MKITPVSAAIPQGELVRVPDAPKPVKKDFEKGEWPVLNAAAQDRSPKGDEGAASTVHPPVAAAPQWQPKPGERVEVRDGDAQEWIPGIFAKFWEDDEGVAHPDVSFPYVCDTETGRECYGQCRPLVPPAASYDALTKAGDGEWMPKNGERVFAWNREEENGFEVEFVEYVGPQYFYPWRCKGADGYSTVLWRHCRRLA